VLRFLLGTQIQQCAGLAFPPGDAGERRQRTLFPHVVLRVVVALIGTPAGFALARELLAWQRAG
jgi:hypothetical protein